VLRDPRGRDYEVEYDLDPDNGVGVISGEPGGFHVRRGWILVDKDGNEWSVESEQRPARHMAGEEVPVIVRNARK